MGSIISLVTGALGGIWGYVAAAVVSAALVGGGAYYITHKVDLATLEKLELADKQSEVEAVQTAATIQKNQDGVNLDAAVAEATAKQKIVTQTVTVTKEIAVHVPDTRACIPYGLIRLLNSAASGSDTASLGITPGQSDDACAPVSWRSLAADLTDDYGSGRQNAEQLNALEADVTGLVTAANGK